MRDYNDLNNPLDVTPEVKEGYQFTQADQTPEIDTLANDAGADAEIEIIEPRKLNRGERRKRAKLARIFAMKEAIEARKRNR